MIPVIQTGFESQGQILYGSRYMAGYVTEEVMKDFQLILVENFSHMGCFSWHILASVFRIPNIEDVREQLKYNDPWSTNIYYWWFPQWMLVKDPEFYRSYIEAARNEKVSDYWWDQENLRSFLDKIMSGSFLELSRIARAFLGHGYTNDGYLPINGHGIIREHIMKLENGDLIAGHGWEWQSHE